MKKQKIYLIILIIILSFVLIIVFNNMTKNKKNGKNINSQEIVDNFLNLSSYKTKISVQVNSNKNQNKYILLQEYDKESGSIQEVLEPENIARFKNNQK